MKNLEERLREYPELYERISELVQVVENAEGDAVKADEAEQRVIEEVRRIGHAALQGWADRKLQRVEQAAAATSTLQRKEKKVSTGRRASGASR